MRCSTFKPNPSLQLPLQYAQFPLTFIFHFGRRSLFIEFTGTQGRLKYFYDELIRTKFDEIVMATYMKLDVKVAPIDSGANCT